MPPMIVEEITHITQVISATKYETIFRQQKRNKKTIVRNIRKKTKNKTSEIINLWTETLDTNQIDLQ